MKEKEEIILLPIETHNDPDTDQTWKEKADLFYNKGTDNKVRAAMIKESGEASWKSYWARKMLTDAACGRVGDSSVQSAGANALYNVLHKYIRKEINEQAKSFFAAGGNGEPRQTVENTMENEVFTWIFKALPKYKPEFAFTTYFDKHVTKGIYTIINQGRDVKKSTTEAIVKVRKRKNAIENEYPDLDENEMLRALSASLPGMAVQKIKESLDVSRLSENKLALDSPEGYAAASHMPTPEEQVIKEEENHEYYAAVKSLPRKTREIYVMSCGLDLEREEQMERGMRPTEVARKLGITKERVDLYMVDARRRIKKFIIEKNGREYKDPLILEETDVPFYDDYEEVEYGMMESARDSTDGAADAKNADYGIEVCRKATA